MSEKLYIIKCFVITEDRFQLVMLEFINSTSPTDAFIKFMKENHKKFVGHWSIDVALSENSINTLFSRSFNDWVRYANIKEIIHRLDISIEKEGDK